MNPELKIFASVWSPPGWMKTNGALIGGSLLDQHIGTLAAYYRKAVQAYAAQGIPIYGVTLQNEPLFQPADYPGMLVSADQERRLARALRTEFVNAGLGGTKIWAFDHNFSQGAQLHPGRDRRAGQPERRVLRRRRPRVPRLRRRAVGDVAGQVELAGQGRDDDRAFGLGHGGR